jgi:hypothetical protein
MAVKLSDDWKEVLRKAWSVRLMAVTALFVGLEAALPNLDGLLPPKTFAILAFVTTVGSFATRLLAQPNMDRGNGAPG